MPKTIVIQTELDSQTGWEGGQNLGLKLPNTSFIAIDNEGSHGAFPYPTEEVNRPVINFFLEGKLPPEVTVAQGVPLPEENVTYETWRRIHKTNGRHVGPVITNPNTPVATTPTLRQQTAAQTEASAALRGLLSDATVLARFRQVVTQTWGAQALNLIR